MSHLDQRDLELFMYAYELLGHRRLESEDEPVTRLPTRVPVRLFSARILTIYVVKLVYIVAAIFFISRILVSHLPLVTTFLSKTEYHGSFSKPPY